MPASSKSIILKRGISETISGKLLLNAGGPMGTGGINLLTGDGTGSGIADGGHIKDEGIDLALPNDQNWKKRISGIGNTVLKTPGIDFPVDDFDAVAFTEEIQTVFDNGDDITMTSVINIGDIFLAQLDSGEVVLVKITDVTETTNNNDDFYTLSIKY